MNLLIPKKQSDILEEIKLRRMVDLRYLSDEEFTELAKEVKNNPPIIVSEVDYLIDEYLHYVTENDDDVEPYYGEDEVVEVGLDPDLLFITKEDIEKEARRQ